MLGNRHVLRLPVETGQLSCSRTAEREHALCSQHVRQCLDVALRASSGEPTAASAFAVALLKAAGSRLGVAKRDDH